MVLNLIEIDFLHPSAETGYNVIIFGVDMNLSAKIDGRKKDILILGKDATKRLKHTLSTEKMHSLNFTENNKKISFSLHCGGANSYLFDNSKEIKKLKAKDSEIVATTLSLGNLSKEW